MRQRISFTIVTVFLLGGSGFVKAEPAPAAAPTPGIGKRI